MMSKYILYLCSARCFRAGQHKPKIAGIINCWQRLGYEVNNVCGGDLYISCASSTSGEGEYEFYQKWYRRTPFMSPFVQSCSEHRDIQHDRLMLDKLVSIINQQRPDIIWERSGRLSSAGLTVAKRFGIPYVLEWIDNLIPYSISWYHRKAVNLERRKNQEADYIVVVSEKLKDDLAQEGVSRDKILVAYNAVDPQEFRNNLAARQEYRAELGIGTNEVLIGYLGSYAFYHDMIRLVLAADILKYHKELSIKILMVGTGKQYEETRRLAERQNLLNTMIIMKPWVPKEMVPRILSALDVAVLPGCTDIMCPIKVQEYMASELATIVPDYPGTREIITEGQTGIFFEPKNEESLAAKLLLLAKDNRLRSVLGRNAREEVLHRFTWEQTWGKAITEVMRRINSKAR